MGCTTSVPDAPIYTIQVGVPATPTESPRASHFPASPSTSHSFSYPAPGRQLPVIPENSSLDVRRQCLARRIRRILHADGDIGEAVARASAAAYSLQRELERKKMKLDRLSIRTAGILSLLAFLQLGRNEDALRMLRIAHDDLVDIVV